MIGYLEGTFRHGTVVTLSGVGYVVACPDELTEGEQVQLHVHTQVRDTAITLYGFRTEADRVLFAALTKVPGMGGTTAISLLRDVGAAASVAAILDNDPAPLTKAAGVGPALAKKIVGLANVPASLEDASGPAVAGPATELAQALAALGYPAATAQKAAAEVLADGDPARTIEQLLPAALARM